MGNHKDEKRRTLLGAEGLLLCLMISLLLSSSLSLERTTQVIGSSGAIMYSTNATLFVTDSTPEGPVPYKIDGASGFQTGSTYDLTAGAHAIELPSPYSSPISGITYYFLYWQDGSTDNPKNVELEANEAFNLNGIYSTSSEPPPPPPPPSSGYFTYIGFENILMGTKFTSTDYSWGDKYIQEGGYPEWGWVNTEGSERWGEIVALPAPLPNGGTRCMQMSSRATPSGLRIQWGPHRLNQNTEIFYWDVYVSYWLYLPTQSVQTSWWSHFEFKEFADHGVFGTSEKSIGDVAFNMDPQGGWFREDKTRYRISILYAARGGQPREAMHYMIYPDGTISPQTLHDGSLGWSPTYATGAPIINPHPVPHDRWFKIELWIKRRADKTGEFHVWLTDPADPEWANGKLLFGATGVQNHYHTYPVKGDMPIVKNYGFYGDVYVDEVYLYNYNPREQS